MIRLLMGKPPPQALTASCREEKTPTGCAVPLTATQLHERYLDAVFQYVSRRVPQRQEAEDITAEVFAAAFTGLSRFQGTSPHAWLLGIARRKIADGLRRRAGRKEQPASELAATDIAANALLERGQPHEATPEQLLQRGEARRQIRLLVDSLGADQREALLLQYVEELSIAEIATVMQKSPQAVNSLLQRARVSLYRAGRDYFLPDTTREDRRS